VLAGDQDGWEKKSRVRTAALASWRTSAQAATLPPRRRHVTVEVGERKGRKCAVVTALDGEVLALYRVASRAGGPHLVAMPPGTAEPPTPLSRSLALHSNSSAGRARSRELRAQSAAVLAQARTARMAAAALAARSQAFRDGPARRIARQQLGLSPHARLKARLATMPVIEQAKGILMAQHRCGPDAAFDLLRRASQRTNVKVHVLAAQIVAQVASQTAESNAESAGLKTPGAGERFEDLRCILGRAL